MQTDLPLAAPSPAAPAGAAEGARSAGVTIDIVRLDLLEAVRPELLLRFLRPFATYLAARAIPLDDLVVSPEWLGALHRVLNAVDPQMPAELQQALLDIADLTTDAAHEQVLALARHQQLSLFTVNARTTPEDLAFVVYLDHRDVFHAAHARTQSSEVRKFVEFVARDRTPPRASAAGGRRALLAQRLGQWFSERNRTAFCDVRVVETDTEIRFLVIHGRPPRSHGAIESDERRGRVSYVPDKHDLLVVDKRSGRLAVNAQYPREQDLYRRALGAVYWDDEEHFSLAPMYTGQPITELGSAALAAHGVPGVVRVALRELTIASEGAVGEAITLIGIDVGPLLDGGLGRLVRRHGVVAAFRLELCLVGRRRPVRLDIRVPSHLSFDRRVGSDVVREYLLEAGFMRMPSAAGGAG